ncbi:unnamed protein product [Rhizophagus irregularis]|nr:unnamed protein product [Rhizophagus irregularis]CAB5201576.1 unnamed protein product [Rhizophagus irregularis]
MCILLKNWSDLSMVNTFYLRQLLDQLPTPKSFDGFSDMLSSFVSSIQKNKKCEGEDHESSIIILAQISISKISVVEIFRLCIYDDIVFRRLRAIIDRDLDNAIKICCIICGLL